MTSDQLYKIVLYATAKNLQDGYVSPEDFYIIINQGQRGYTDYLKGEYQKYQTKRPISVVEFGQNEMIRASLMPLIYGTIMAVDAGGIAVPPSDFEYPDAMWGLYGYYNIRFVQQDRLQEYYRSQIDPIQTNPIYVIQHEGFHFFPENIGSARMSYIRTPPSIVWGWRYDSNGIQVYDPSTSQDPVWAETDCLQIIVRALQLVGVNLQFNTVLQYANEIKTAGQ